MPEWFNPVLNTSVAVGLVGFACWGIVKACHWFDAKVWPKTAAIADGHVAMMATMSDNSIKQTALSERQTNMLDSVVATQNIHGQDIKAIKTTVGEIHEKINRTEKP